MAGPTPQSRHHRAVVSVADAPRQYRLPSSASFIWHTLQRLGILSGPYQITLGGARPPLGTLGTLGSPRTLRRPLAWSSHIPPRWIRLFHARYACVARRVRPAR